MISHLFVRRIASAFAVALAFLAAPALARAAGLDWVTAVSQPGDWVGGGHSYLFDSATGTVQVGGTLHAVEVSASGGNDPSSDGLTLEFAAAQGQQLQDGAYDDATLYPIETGDSPGISVSGNGDGCDYANGWFTINDIGTDAEGNVDRLWLTYAQQCGASGVPPSASTPWLFGEVRIGEPAATAPETAEPASVVWPLTGSGTPGTTVPITIVAGSDGADIATLAVTGGDAGDFLLGDGTCGAVLAPGARCQALVTFAPNGVTSLSASLLTAALQITDGSGATSTVTLGGTSYGLPGTTTLLTDVPTASVFGTPVAYEASVWQGSSSSTSAEPTGTIQYSIDGQPVGTPSPIAEGDAQDALIGVLDVGSTVGAAYSGDANFAPSSTTIAPDISPAPTTLTLAQSATTANAWAPFTVAANVADPITGFVPVGSIQFTVNGAPVLSPEPLDDNGDAAIIGQEPPGTYVIGATYQDDVDPVSDFVGSSASVTETVTATATATASTTSTTTATTTAAVTSSSTTTSVKTSSSSSGVEATSTLLAASGGGGAATYVGSPVVKANGRIFVPVESARGGTFSAVATTSTPLGPTRAAKSKRSVAIGSGKVKVAAKRDGELTIVLSGAARRAIARGATLRVRIAVTYRPAKGKSSSTVVSVADGPTSGVTRRVAAAERSRLAARSPAAR